MTGFGRAACEKEGGKLTIEIKSVNHRFLDINIRSPRTLMFLEDELRAMIKAKIARGRLDVYVNFEPGLNDDKRAVADIGLIRSYLRALKQIKREAGLKNDIALSHVMRIPDAIRIEEKDQNEKALRNLMLEAAAQALERLAEMRSREGQNLAADINSRLSVILKLTELIESREGVVIDEFKERLRKRLSEIVSAAEIDDTRVAQEVVIYADKQNITEETVRIRNHVDSFRAALSSAEPTGRQLDFIVQELNREFNTIGSKSSDMDITNAVLSAKSEIEKIREQVQNLE